METTYLYFFQMKVLLSLFHVFYIQSHLSALSKSHLIFDAILFSYQSVAISPADQDQAGPL